MKSGWNVIQTLAIFASGLYLFTAGLYLFKLGHPVAGGWTIVVAFLSFTIRTSNKD